MWRFACFLAGLPLGALAALVLWPEPWPLALQVGAIAGGLCLVAVASLAARRHRGETERGRHLAAGASAAWLALPALAASWLGLAPGPRFWLVAVTALLAVSLFRRARRPGPASLVSSLLLAPAVALLAGTAGVLAVAGVLSVVGAPPLDVNEHSANFVWDADARVVTRPLPDCEPRVATHRVLLERGAHPRIGPEGLLLWFEAEGPEGRRQVHRLDRESGEVVCWTCGEPGNNRRPAVSSSGLGVVFDTDRHATAQDPTNTEVHLAGTKGDEPARVSRRLTRNRGPDDHAILAPGGVMLVWSRGLDGRYAVAAAALQSGHGGLLLGDQRVLRVGGPSWVAPLAWSPDGHALLVAEGHPLRTASVEAIDFATGERWSLGGEVVPGASAGFSADGSYVALASARRADGLGLVPDFFGFVVGRVASVLGREGRFREGGVRSGPREAPPPAIDLEELQDWGVPTGVDLDPDGRGFVLGQRSPAGDERLVEVALECREPAATEPAHAAR